MGGANLLPINTLADVSQLVHGMRFFHSPDLLPFAASMLRDVVRRRVRRPPQPNDVAEFLNGSMADDFQNHTTEVTNTWTRLRVATRQLQTKIDIK
jgi:hypothetical protein